MSHFGQDYNGPIAVKRSSISKYPHRQDRNTDALKNPVNSQGKARRVQTAPPPPNITEEYEYEEPRRHSLLWSAFLFVTWPLRMIVGAFWIGFTAILAWSWAKGHFQRLALTCIGFLIVWAFVGQMVTTAFYLNWHKYQAAQGMLNTQVLDYGQGSREVITGVDRVGRGYILVIKDTPTANANGFKADAYLLPERQAENTWIDVSVQLVGSRKVLVVQPFGRPAHALYPQSNGTMLWDRES